MTVDHAARRGRAWARLVETAPEVEGFLVTSPANVRYLCGFTGSNGVLLLTADAALLGTDGRYVIQAGTECPGLQTLIDRATVPAMARAWSAMSAGPLAIESDAVSVAQLRELEGILEGNDRIREVSGVVERCRIVKDADEWEMLTRACAISDEALAMTLAHIRVGVTERQVARTLEGAMLDLGASAISFETIVGGGPHSAIPHHQPTDRPLQTGDLLVIDFGAEVGGYHADETRTFVMGEPADWQRDIHALVLSAQSSARDAVTAGAGLASVDAAARSIIEDAGYGEYFAHGLGHGVGLQIHEAPFMSSRATGMLMAGSPVTVEPGVYLPDRGGVRIEDTVSVTEGPCVPLTATRRELTVLD